MSDFTPVAELFGLDAPIRALWGALERDRVAGSYLLKGPTGVGKTALALAFAQAAACVSPKRDPYGACERCESCRRVASGAHPEIALIAPAGDMTQIWQFWDRERRPPGVLEHSLPFAPVIGRRRVFILERADTLTEGAANSILKALEEPPPYAVFMLLTPSIDRLLPTILSRCQVVPVNPPGPPAVADWLVRRHGLVPDRAVMLAALAEGLPGAALRMAREEDLVERITECARVALKLAHSRPLGALRVAEEMRAHAAAMKPVPSSSAGGPEADGEGDETQTARAARSGITAVLDVAMTVFRDLLACSLDPAGDRIVHRAMADDLRRTAARARPEAWAHALDVLLEARRRIEQNVPAQLVTDWLATDIVQRLREGRE